MWVHIPKGLLALFLKVPAEWSDRGGTTVTYHYRSGCLCFWYNTSQLLVIGCLDSIILAFHLDEYQFSSYQVCIWYGYFLLFRKFSLSSGAQNLANNRNITRFQGERNLPPNTIKWKILCIKSDPGYLSGLIEMLISGSTLPVFFFFGPIFTLPL